MIVNFNYIIERIISENRSVTCLFIDLFIEFVSFSKYI